MIGLGNTDGDRAAFTVAPTDEPFTTTFRFDWVAPPLSLNYRMHRFEKSRITKQLRALMKKKAKHLPHMARCRVSLVWVVTDKKRRDEDNIVETLKPLCDGLVDAGVVKDDTKKFMDKDMPAIRWIDKAIDFAHFEFTITEVHA